MNKLCIPISIENCFPKALVVFKGIEKNLNTIKSLGYDGIELALFHKDNIDVKKIKKLVEEYGLQIPVISTGQMFTMLKVWFTHVDKEVRKRAVEEFKGIIDVAAEFGADINVSRVRGFIDDNDTIQEGLKKLTECLNETCEYAKQYNLNIVLEQMNRFETNYLFSVSDVGEYIKNQSISNLKIHADVFHMNIEDADIYNAFREYKDYIGYVHYCDSNRLAPGKGHLDFAKIQKTLREIKYDGWIGLEVLPVPDPFTAAKDSIDYLKSIKLA